MFLGSSDFGASARDRRLGVLEGFSGFGSISGAGIVLPLTRKPKATGIAYARIAGSGLGLAWGLAFGNPMRLGLSPLMLHPSASQQGRSQGDWVSGFGLFGFGVLVLTSQGPTHGQYKH